MLRTHYFPHLTDEKVELYALGSLSAAQTRTAEEHQLQCVACRDCVREMREFVAVLRAATFELNQQEPGTLRDLLPLFDSRPRVEGDAHFPVH